MGGTTTSLVTLAGPAIPDLLARHFDDGALRRFAALIVIRSGNSWRSFAVIEPAGPPPEAIAPGNSNPVPFALVEQGFPGAEDVLFSPGRDTVMVVVGKEIVVYDALGKKVGATLPLGGRIVMAEWTTVEKAAGWMGAAP